MPLSISTATEPTFEPVSLLDARRHCRVTSTEEDSTLQDMIKEAREWVEEYLGRTLMKTTYALKVDAFPGVGWQLEEDGFRRGKDGTCFLVLPRPPLLSVSSVAYLDGDGASQTLAATVYSVDTTSQPGRLFLAYGQSWPTTRAVPHAVTVTYVAGYSSSAVEATQQAAVPYRAKRAVKIILASLFAHRESFVTGTIATELPFSATQLLRPLRVLEAA